MNSVILAQTDTTVGFLSQDASRLAKIKARPPHKPFIQSFSSLQTYKEMGGRVPQQFKNRLRRSKSTTFVINNRAVRIVSQGPHHKLLQKFGWLYSTSANAANHPYERGFAEEQAEIIVEDSRKLFEGKSSHIFKLHHYKLKQLR